MRLLRRRLALVVCGWLACQLGSIVGAPISLWTAMASDEGPACECPVTCKLRNAFPASDAALFAQSGGFGILPGSTSGVSAFHPGAVVRTSTPVAIAKTYVPDAPPPRA